MDPSVFHVAVAQAMNADRPDLFWGVDKALRLSVGRTLARIGSMDCSDDVDVAQVIGRVREVLRLLDVQRDVSVDARPAWPTPGGAARAAHAGTTDEPSVTALGDCATSLEFARGETRRTAAAELEATLGRLLAQLDARQQTAPAARAPIDVRRASVGRAAPAPAAPRTAPARRSRKTAVAADPQYA
ncbi:MAG TPA: hypothetical protein PKB08_11585 [Burkholderiaceae bacterium]|nr:hypothetical protein [Burkholderiaceae bacterium]